MVRRYVKSDAVGEFSRWLVTLADPTFAAILFGPFESQGESILFIASNDDDCGYYRKCGPPWPSNTPKQPY